EAECRCPTAWFDAGDQMQGTLASNLVHGRSVVETFNAMGLAAAAVGNHDLDWSVDTLRARMADAAYPWLAANVFDSATGSRPGWARPWAVIEVDSFRIGVIGYMTLETKSIVKAEHVRGLEWRPVESMRGALDSLAREEPDLIMLLAHAGMVCDSTQCDGEIREVTRALAPRIDAVVAGHVHRLGLTDVDGVPIAQTWGSGSAIGLLDLVRGSDGTQRWECGVASTYADRVTPDRAAERRVGNASTPRSAVQ